MGPRFTRRGVLRAAGAAAGTAGLAGRVGAALPDYPSEAWFERELRNYAKTQEAPAEQSDPSFLSRWQAQSGANAADYHARTRTEPGWRSHGNRCAQYGEQCTGDPRLYPAVDDFYGEVGVRHRVAFHDRDGARLSGHVWAPADADAADDLPGVVVTNGSVQSPETAYWWFAQTLVRAGYVVLTYDPRGQGRSDTATPDGEPGTNVDPSVFVTNQVDAVDFFHATPARPYPHDPDGESPAPVRGYNPFHAVLDRSRLGLVGHSAGAIGASIVQGLEPWPGARSENPVDALVAWDNLGEVDEVDPYAGGSYDDAGVDALVDGLGREVAPDGDVTPRVPAMGQAADYFRSPVPKAEPPAGEAKARAYERWTAAGVPAYQLVVRGGTHYEWSRVPSFPATSWSFGNELADHYSLAWLDRWLKRPGEPGYADADARLLADDRYADRLSFYYRSARDFPGRGGERHRSRDLREDAGAPDAEALLAAVTGD